MDKSLGLARNIPCTLDDITFYLQIHVLWSPTYDILLGCPFDVLTKSVVNTLNKLGTTIMVMDPNSGLCCTIPAFLCGQHKAQKVQLKYSARLPIAFAITTTISTVSNSNEDLVVVLDYDHQNGTIKV